jgi:hypothetical protein
MMASLATRGRRRVPFTQAQIRRAVKAAESAGLKVKGVTITVDGAITVDTGEVNQPVAKTNNSKAPQGASWDDI